MSLMRLSVSYQQDGFGIDRVTLERTGTVRISGWSGGGPPVDAITVTFDGATPGAVLAYREWRPDRLAAGAAADAFSGFVLEFRPPGEARGGTVVVKAGGQTIFDAHGPFAFVEHHYSFLLDTSQVRSRAEIYTSGPPPVAFNAPSLDLALTAPGRILDFGCGSGAYLRALRQRGREVDGLEIDTPGIRASLKPDVAPHVRLYDGRFPAPVEDGSYDTCIAFEVLEHIPRFREAIAELARMTRRLAIVSVPDASAIPTLSPHYAVPWHLLEAGHVNFFTQQSLGACLATHFETVEFVRICPFEINGTVAYTSVAALCHKRAGESLKREGNGELRAGAEVTDGRAGNSVA